MAHESIKDAPLAGRNEPTPRRWVKVGRTSLSVRLCFETALVVVVAAIALYPLPAAWVERRYSTGFYPRVQATLTPLANRVPFAILDLIITALVLGVGSWWVLRLRRAGRGKRLRAAVVLLFHAAAIAAAIFLGFQVLWGFNYSREPLIQKLDYDSARVNVEAVRNLKRMTVGILNAESAEVHNHPWPDEDEWRGHLAVSFNDIVPRLEDRKGIAPAIPKRSLLNPYLGAAGIEGFVNPFGQEVILQSGLLPAEKPFLLAHEWGHLAGFADESEASFVGMLACLRSDMLEVQYSGWLSLYMQTPWPRNAASEDGEDVGDQDLPPRLAPEVAADLKAILERERKARIEAVDRVQWAFYDRFLKANHVRAGIASYSLLIDLLVGTRFESVWVPELRKNS